VTRSEPQIPPLRFALVGMTHREGRGKLIAELIARSYAARSLTLSCRLGARILLHLRSVWDW
jgi:hypothetical protein